MCGEDAEGRAEVVQYQFWGVGCGATVIRDQIDGVPSLDAEVECGTVGEMDDGEACGSFGGFF